MGNCSTRIAGKQISMSCVTVWKILRKQMKFYPYRMHMSHQLLSSDYSERMHFAEWCLETFDSNPDFFRHVLWSDECHFYLNGHVNTHNCVLWGSSKPTNVIQVPLHSDKLTVWCGFNAFFILKPLFLEETINMTIAR